MTLFFFEVVLGLIIHTLTGYIQSIYLIQEKERLLLLDGCCYCDFERVKQFIEIELQLELKNLELVITTHAHPDHMGALKRFKKHGIPIAGPEGINIWYKGPVGIATYIVDILLTHFVARAQKKKFKRVLFSRKIELDYILKDGSQVPGFNNWKVIESPGHTSMDLTLYHTKEEIAYVADNILSSQTKIFSPYPICFPELYKASLQKYLDLGITEYLLAHHNRMTISKAEVQDLIAKTPSKPKKHSNMSFQILKKILNHTISKK